MARRRRQDFLRFYEEASLARSDGTSNHEIAYFFIPKEFAPPL